ncbi:MAG: SDR family oxidoreductase [Oscillospiraceae bacterium]|nr:SDR family oxidoreductase [Oscillospiraceae bacterium]
MGKRLEGKIAIVTASTRGIGRAIADAYVDEGAKVWFAVRNLETGKQAVDAAIARGGKADLVYFEADDYPTHTKMVEEVLAKDGRIDILVNNFGGSNPVLDTDFEHANWEEYMKTVERNVATVFNASHAAITKAMIPQKSGSIINIGSVAGVVPDVTQCGYGCAKATILYLTKQIALQCGKYNIRANVLHPGITATEAVRKHLPPAVQEQFLGGCPIHRLAEPTEMASLAVYLGSDESQYTTGQDMRVCGGFDVCSPIYATFGNLKEART